ncbi:hypothetical protein T479_14520 [Lysinibacillus varians]|uniref:hypothetical protein n=1 Tax=Lysinibacillus varians TaxID=1145276 RepID=UPI00042F5B46|nr:hypothetical protein [Lysinibacillus varians]AHN22397.1 hypothetical protein T479_14520 [Lysinibacillus varians]
MIYYARGDKLNAALSVGAMIPFAGMAVTGGKLVTKGAKAFNGVVDGIKTVTNKGSIGQLKEKATKKLDTVKDKFQTKVAEVKDQLRQLGTPQLEFAGVNVGRITDTGTVGKNKPSNSSKPPAKDSKPAEGTKGAGNNSSGRDVYGPYYDEAKKLHETKPDWYPNPDESKIVKGKELKEARVDYQTLVRRGELEKGHHKQGLSFGGENVSSNIKKTGESTIRQKEIDELDLDFYHEMGYGKENAKILKIHENEKGIIVFGNNPQHTEVTVFQNKVLKWQKENGKR